MKLYVDWKCWFDHSLKTYMEFIFSVIEHKYYIASRNLKTKIHLCFRQVQKNDWLNRIGKLINLLLLLKVNIALHTANQLERLQMTNSDKKCDNQIQQRLPQSNLLENIATAIPQVTVNTCFNLYSTTIPNPYDCFCTKGPCNGTILRIVGIIQRVLRCRIISGDRRFAGNLVFILRITLAPSAEDLPIPLQQWQFPVWLAFAMTIDKSQRQLLAHVGLDLRTSVFFP